MQDLMNSTSQMTGSVIFALKGVIKNLVKKEV